jgi:acyl-CoA reductase-like NAD-dependent aldehyde dehydrogenase
MEKTIVNAHINEIFDVVYEQEKDGKKAFKNFLNGQWIHPESADYFSVNNPATGESFASAPLCGEEHIDLAIESANESQYSDDFSPLERLEVVEKAAQILSDNAEGLARSITEESGKPIGGARREVHATVERLRLAREEARVLYGEYIPGEWVEDTEGKFAIVLRNSIGVVGTLSPFNYPLFIGAAKIIPALLAGNSVVAKPASDTPISLLLFGRILQKAGLAYGRLQILTGKGSVLGSCMAENPQVAAISFTGSTSAGKSIASQAGMKKLHLELGGKAAAIVLQDADIQCAASEICKGTFKNSGQRCDAVSRVLVYKDIHKRFAEAVLDEASSYKVGSPLDEDTKIGPLINERALEKVDRLVSSAIDAGARPLCGARHEGFFYNPTVLDGVTRGMDIAEREIFGPVMPIMTFDTIEEAVDISNSSEYGLDSCVFTDNLKTAISVAKRLQDGSVSVNAAPAHGVGHFPFGGNKKSGMGREGLKYSIDELTRLHTIVINE